MRKLILPFLLCCFSLTLAAQDVTLPAPHNQELGIFGQTMMNNDDGVVSLVGLQYKHWHNEHLGYRILGAFGQYYSSGSELQHISGDTVITRQQHFNISLPVLGFGLEAQRHFYKNIYLFAAVELRGGYGSGIADTSVSMSSGQSTQHLGQNVGSHDVSLLYFGLAPSIGARLQWSRLCLGLEIFPIHAAYTQRYDTHSDGSILDLNMGSLNQRLSIAWRF